MPTQSKQMSQHIENIVPSPAPVANGRANEKNLHTPGLELLRALPRSPRSGNCDGRQRRCYNYA